MSKSDNISLKVSIDKVSSLPARPFKAVWKTLSLMVGLSVFLMFSRHLTSGLTVSGNIRVLASIHVKEERPAVKMDCRASAAPVRPRRVEVITRLSPLQRRLQVSEREQRIFKFISSQLAHSEHPNFHIKRLPLLIFIWLDIYFRRFCSSEKFTSGGGIRSCDNKW